MTAPGQEPDEVITAKPEGTEDATRPPKLDDIGDTHMPEDLREAEHEKAESERGAATRTDDEADDDEPSAPDAADEDA